MQHPALMRNVFVLAMTLGLAAGCGKKAEEGPPPEPGSAQVAAPQPVASPTEEAATLFKTVCASCHGETGVGDGPAAATLDPKPRNYTDKAWQASVTDEQIKQTILLGGAGVGKSPLMPAQPQLKDKPEVLDALVKHIRSFGK